MKNDSQRSRSSTPSDLLRKKDDLLPVDTEEQKRIEREQRRKKEAERQERKQSDNQSAQKMNEAISEFE